MKKLLALVLAVVILCCSAAFAESSETYQIEQKANPLFSPDNFSTALPNFSSDKPAIRPENMAPVTTDTVSVNSNNVIVKTAEGVLMMANIPANYSCITQDYAASIFSLISYNNPEKLVQDMIDEGTHLLFVNGLNDDWIKIIILEPDAVSSMFGTLNNLSSDRINEYAKAFSATHDLSFNDVVTTGSNIWMRFDDRYFITLAGGYYVLALWIGDEGDTFTDDVFEDVKDVLKELTLFG